MGSWTDITARKTSEVAVLEASHRMQLAAEAARVASWDWDSGTGITTWSSEEIDAISLQLRRGEAGGKSLRSVSAMETP